jgi:hypothetical protein
MIPKGFPSHQEDPKIWIMDAAHRGRKANPSFSLIDSQSVETTWPGEERGFDGGKR